MNSVLTFLTQGTNGLDRSRANQMAEQQRLATTQNEDRLRAELSPMDGPQGSGTGAMPSLDQQMRALDDARLRDPAVAGRFAPVVQQRRMAELMQGRPIEERLATELNPERAGQSYASQFEDVPLAAGTVRSRGGNIIAAAPRTERFDDRFGTYDPMTGETTYSQPRDMTEDERSRRIAAERPQIANLGTGDQAFGVDPSGGVTPLAVNTNRPGGVGGQQFDATTRGALQSARDFTGSANRRISAAREFIQLNQEHATGIGSAGPLGLVARLRPAYDRMDSLAAGLIPKEREPGSGPMSDRDIGLYGRAVINIGRPGPANQAIANAAIAQAERDIEYSQFLDAYAQQNGNIVGSTEDWQAYVNANPLLEEGPNGLIQRRPADQVQSWRDFMGYGERQRGGTRGQSQAAPQGQSGGRVYENPQTGERIRWNGSAWVPAQ